MSSSSICDAKSVSKAMALVKIVSGGILSFDVDNDSQKHYLRPQGRIKTWRRLMWKEPWCNSLILSYLVLSGVKQSLAPMENQFQSCSSIKKWQKFLPHQVLRGCNRVVYIKILFMVPPSWCLNMNWFWIHVDVTGMWTEKIWVGACEGLCGVFHLNLGANHSVP